MAATRRAIVLAWFNEWGGTAPPIVAFFDIHTPCIPCKAASTSYLAFHDVPPTAHEALNLLHFFRSAEAATFLPDGVRFLVELDRLRLLETLTLFRVGYVRIAQWCMWHLTQAGRLRYSLQRMASIADSRGYPVELVSLLLPNIGY